MNYLELVQTTLLLLRAGNERLSAPIESLEGLSGINYEVAQWVKMADRDIQNSRAGWLFLRRSAEVDAPAGQRVIDVRSALTDLASVIPSTGDGDGRFITTYGADRLSEIKCHFIPWEMWRGSVYDRAPFSVSEAPIRFTIQPDGRMVLDPAPTVPRRMLFDYRMMHVPMTDGSSESLIPPQHHMAIVMWAIARYYCLTRDAINELRAKAGMEMEREMQRMYNDQLPEITYGGTST